MTSHSYRERKTPEPTADAVAALLIRAQNGDADAQYQLGEIFRIGEVVPVDYAEALRWLHAAAQQNHPHAQNNLGSMYLNGMGTNNDPEEAVTWYRKAAELGQLDAEFNLALRYLHGDGVAIDATEAARWLQEAACQGHVEAIGQLGTLYRFGNGVQQNFVHAAEHHVIAAMEGDVTSIGNLQDYQDEIEKAAMAGSVVAVLCIAKMYDRGLAVAKDKAHVYAWLQWAKQHGTTDNDDDALSELAEWERFESMTIPEDEKQQGEKLLAQMNAAEKEGKKC